MSRELDQRAGRPYRLKHPEALVLNDPLQQPLEPSVTGRAPAASPRAAARSRLPSSTTRRSRVGVGCQGFFATGATTTGE